MEREDNKQRLPYHEQLLGWFRPWNLRTEIIVHSIATAAVSLRGYEYYMQGKDEGVWMMGGMAGLFAVHVINNTRRLIAERRLHSRI